MRIGIDARFYGPKHAGLGRYTKNLVDQLLNLDDQNDYVIFLSPDNYDLVTTTSGRVAKVQIDAPHYSLKEQLVLPGILRRHSLDVVHFPHLNVPLFYNRPYVVTIHDLIMHKFKNRAVTTRVKPVYELKHLGYRLVTRWAATRAKKVICPSQAVRQELLDFYRLPEDRVIATPEAADDLAFQPVADKSRIKDILKKYHLKQPFLIYVGNVYPHKNIEILAQAMQTLSTEHNFQLIMPGARDIFRQRTQDMVDHYQISQSVILPGFVPDDELAILYSQATAYVFPSLAEGFGLPPLEAMTSGLPVICSDIPVLHEVCSSAALYFNPHDPADLTAQVLKLTTQPGLRHRMVAAGQAQAKKFSWQTMAQQTLEVYTSLA